MEFRGTKPSYQAIIKDVTGRMGTTIADFWRNGERDEFNINTMEEYDQYCYYGAAILGEGITQMFVEAGFAKRQASAHTRSVSLLY